MRVSAGATKNFEEWMQTYETVLSERVYKSLRHRNVPARQTDRKLSMSSMVVLWMRSNCTGKISWDAHAA
jgi:hypothetical protein